MFVRESFEQLLSVTEDVPAFLITIAVENCDKVENFSAAKWVLDQMGPWTGPEDHLVPPKMLRHFSSGQHRTIGDVSRDARRPVADQDLSDVGPQSISTDQRTPFDTASVFELNRYTVITIRKASYLCGDRELDCRFSMAGIDNCVVQIGSVRDSVGIRKRFWRSRDCSEVHESRSHRRERLA